MTPALSRRYDSGCPHGLVLFAHHLRFPRKACRGGCSEGLKRAATDQKNRSTTPSNVWLVRFSCLLRHGLCRVATYWCDSKVNALNNPGVRPNWYNIFLSRISALIHFVSRVNLEAEV